jgi:tetratricopeptide (TPR) repeat protein
MLCLLCLFWVVAVNFPVSLAQGADAYQRAEQAWRRGDYLAASDYFRTAVAREPGNADYKVRWGRLFYARFQPADAQQLFEEALKIKPDHVGAILGLALVASDSFENQAVELAQRAVKLDPKLVAGYELLARLALEDGDQQKAEAEADRALAISDRALDAMATRATIDLLNGKTESPWLERILKIDPHYGEAYAVAGRHFILNRRYEEGIALYRKAIERDPRLWPAHSELGVNLMRLGEEEEARKHLELAYNANYRNPATVNTLRLIDSYRNFETIRTGSFILKLHKKEAALLRPYMETEIRRAMQTYEKKYKFKLGRPVQVEVYPDHEDFAVRTLGMPGLGALGVTFGYVVAMDSPSARKPGTFHWASALWHEMSHVYTLTATDHRIPRWFTEGLAVYEETAVSPDWGDRLSPEVIAAIKEKKLLPVAELDRGFVRPSYPSQVLVSYFQAGQVCGFIAQKWGYDKLVAMVSDFASPKTTAEVIERQLGVKPEVFDRQFLGWLESQTRKTVEGFDKWREGIKTVAAAAREQRYDDVIREGQAIRDIYPDYVEPGSVYEFLADAWVAKGDKAKAAAELEAYAHSGGRSPALLKQLASLQQEAGREKDAAATLNLLNYIAPAGDEELHRWLGNLYFDTGSVDEAIREFQAVIDSNPHDRAAAHYDLARAYRAADRTDQARDQVVLALEAAPGFKPALKLLLELSK